MTRWIVMLVAFMFVTAGCAEMRSDDKMMMDKKDGTMMEKSGHQDAVADDTIAWRADSSIREDVLDPVVLDHDGRAPP